MLVRLRGLTPQDLMFDCDGLADLLWQRGLDERGLLDSPRDNLYRVDAARLFRPVWLLDGLDEVPPVMLGPDLPRRLATPPGLKLVPCRTAVFQSQREFFAPYQGGQAEYEILPLAPAEWRNFLAACLEDPARAATLSTLVSGNVAEVFKASEDNAPLPATRADFYRQSATYMWHRRLTNPDRRERLRPWRDKVLDALASQMELRIIEAGLDDFDATVASVPGAPPDIKAALQDAGLLAIEEHREVVRFFHLTFQEFHLAHTLASRER
jgi:hypothetical protein